MNPALETLMLAFSGEEGLPVPSRALFLGAEPHPALRDWPEVIGWQPFKPLADSWERAGFSRVDAPSGRWPAVLMLPGKSRDETLGWFGLASDLLEPGGLLVVAMANRAGAARFQKELATAAGGVEGLSKNKARAFHAVKDDRWNFARFADWLHFAEPGPVVDTEFVAHPGTFSSDRVDAGSRFLADHLPAHLKGAVADLGAGWGFLSDAVLRRCPKVERMDLYEADARALACARHNLARHSRERRFHWHDVATGLPETYDAIVTNPPFHRGQETDIELGRSFIHAAARGLKRGGKLFLVANRQLPYEAELDAAGLVWRTAAENETFKLLFADRR